MTNYKEYDFDRYANYVNPEDPEPVWWGIAHCEEIRKEAEKWALEHPEEMELTIEGASYKALRAGGEFLINLCPHGINIVLPSGADILVPPSGQLARCKAITVRTGRTFCGIPVSRTDYGAVEGLPAPMNGIGFVVSGLVKGRVPERDDVFAPSETVRNPEGQVAGATSLGE